jgi:hypothetical protein
MKYDYCGKLKESEKKRAENTYGENEKYIHNFS